MDVGVLCSHGARDRRYAQLRLAKRGASASRSGPALRPSCAPAALNPPNSMQPVLIDRIPAPARRLLGPVLNSAVVLANRMRRRAARAYLMTLYGGEGRRRLLEAGLGRYYRGLFKRQWQWADELPHFFDHRIGSFEFAVGKQHGFAYYRGYFAAELLRGGDVVLDIGCGDGFFARRFFAPRAAAIDSIDIEERAIAHANAHNGAPNIRFLLCDAVHQPFPRDSYDLIVWDGALGHFAPDTTSRMLDKIRAALAPGGAFVGSESLGHEGHDHLQFFASLDDLGALLGAHFPFVELRFVEYEIGAGAMRTEAFWRCAIEPERLTNAHWRRHADLAPPTPPVT
jgi:SAM-dependent methyltransferase